MYYSAYVGNIIVHFDLFKNYLTYVGVIFERFCDIELYLKLSKYKFNTKLIGYVELIIILERVVIKLYRTKTVIE